MTFLFTGGAPRRTRRTSRPIAEVRPNPSAHATPRPAFPLAELDRTPAAQSVSSVRPSPRWPSCRPSFRSPHRPAPVHSLDLKVPPLVVLAVVAGLMWLGARAVPAAGFSLPARPAIALALAVSGVVTALAGVVSFRRAKTTVNPLKPETAASLVVSGIYRVTRNPMYLGALVVLIAWALFLANALAFALAATFVLYLNRFQIAPEEKALTSLFGSEFTAYCAKVRRWI